MPKFNEIIRADTKQINWLNSNYTDGTVYVDNSFQRRTVWVLKNKIRLIETILKGFPMPEIYLWAGQAEPTSGDTSYSVVDGQQRLTAIRDFIAGVFKLDAKVLDRKPANASYHNKKFDELSVDDRQAIWEYNITTRVIPSSVSKDEIVAIFLRLNETDKSLNPQELRNAEFNGLFIENVERAANLKFWEVYKVFNASAIRRMGDLQFVSSLIMFLRSGIEAEVSQESINSMYDTYNDLYADADRDFKMTRSILRIVDRIFKLSPEVAKFFKSQVHLYALFIVIFQQRANKKLINEKKWARRLAKFAKEYAKENPSSVIENYRAAATEGTLKRANREDRVNFLRDWVTRV
jgi:uncharacterized protein with ParB-like and HNH nuclease domain